MTERFLDLEPTSATPPVLQNAISQCLRQYWAGVFHYDDGTPAPSFEDHFTVLDLAANTGHHSVPHTAPGDFAPYADLASTASSTFWIHAFNAARDWPRFEKHSPPGTATLSLLRIGTSPLNADNAASTRYQQFFGAALDEVHTDGFEAWAAVHGLAAATPDLFRKRK